MGDGLNLSFCPSSLVSCLKPAFMNECPQIIDCIDVPFGRQERRLESKSVGLVPSLSEDLISRPRNVGE